MSNIKGKLLAGLIAIFAALSTSSLMAHPGGRGLTELTPDKVEWGLTFFRAPDFTVYLLGMDGHVVNQWGTPADEIIWAKPVFDPRGDILTLTGVVDVPGYAIPLPYKMAQYDVDGDLFFEWNNFELERGEFAALHHDMQRLPNGNTLVICLAIVDEPGISDKTLLDDCLIEVDWAGNVVWEWHTYEHFDEFNFSDEAKQMISEFAGDWAHANSVNIIPENQHSNPIFTPGNIIVSYRQLNTVVIIDRLSGEIVWKLGPNGSPTIGQHHAHMIEQGRLGAGNILIFDNGLAGGFPPVSRAFSRVLEVDPTTKSSIWQYNSTYSGFQPWDFFSPIVSGAQRLENGNTVITEGTKGRLFEITPEGELVWEYFSPYYDTVLGGGGHEYKDYTVFRSYRMPLFWGWPTTPPE
jgi:hypothetical protein